MLIDPSGLDLIPSQRYISVNGVSFQESEPSILAIDRGFTLGDGVFETMRARSTTVLFLDEHLSRLQHAAGVLDLSIPRLEDFQFAITEILQANSLPDSVLRLTLTRGPDAGRGLSSPSEAIPTVVIRVSPYPPRPIAFEDTGVSAILSSVMRNEGSPLSRIKSCNYGDNILARRAAHSVGADDAILLNSRGELACATASNLLILRDGILHTPPPSSGVLNGITCYAVCRIATERGIPVEISPLSVDALQEADEAFLTNSVSGIRPLTCVDGREISNGHTGPITSTLSEAYEVLVQFNLGPLKDA